MLRPVAVCLTQSETNETKHLIKGKDKSVNNR